MVTSDRLSPSKSGTHATLISEDQIIHFSNPLSPVNLSVAHNSETFTETYSISFSSVEDQNVHYRRLKYISIMQ